jgi:acyl carrier protein
MLPGHFVQIEALPLTSSGKIDKGKLPAPDVSLLKFEYMAPESETEKKVTKIWQEILGIEKISVNDNFFAIGGHSLKAIRVVSRIHQEFGIKIDVKNLFSDSTIAYLSKYIDTVSWVENEMEISSEETDNIIL